MTKLYLNVTGANAAVEKVGLLTTGMVGVTVECSFDDRWDGLNRLAVFRCGEVKKDNVLHGNTTQLPHEVLTVPGEMLHIGVEGRSKEGDLVIPTVWAEAGRVLPGAQAAGDPALAPTPSQYDRLMAQMERVNEKTDGVVRHSPQTLTEEQKAQARANIGAAAAQAQTEPARDVVLTSADFEKGKYGAGGKMDDNTVVRIKEPIKAMPGDCLCVDAGENIRQYYVSFYPELNGGPNWDGWRMVSGWESRCRISTTEAGYYAIQFINNDRTDAVSAADFDGYVVLYKSMASDIDLRKKPFTQISDPFAMTSASGVRAAYDSTSGLIGCVYMGDWLKYGEQHGKTVLTIFSASNPNEKKHVWIPGSFVYEVNIVALGNRVWRVLMCRGKHGWFYRDYDLDTNTLGDEQEMFAVIDGTNVSMSAQNRANYAGDTLGAGEYMTTLTSSLFKDADGKYYGCWGCEWGRPVLFYSENDMQTIVPFAVFEMQGNYEASFIKKNGTIMLIQRSHQGNCIGLSGVSNGEYWRVQGRRGDDNRPSVYLVNGNVVWLYGLRDRNQVAISFGDDFFNPEKTIVFESPWGCVYADMIIVNDSLYLLYSDSQLAMDVTNGANNNRKDCIKFVKLMDDVFG